MEKYQKPIPRITEETRPYWEGCAQHKLLIQKCERCGQFQFYPRIYCASCLNECLKWVESEGKGIIYSFSAVYRPPSKVFSELPYIVAIIELDEGVKLMSNLLQVSPAEVYIGMRVKVVFEDVNEKLAIPRFVPFMEIH